MIQLDNQSKSKRNKQYNDWARKYPSYITIILPIVLGLIVGAEDYLNKANLGKEIKYILSISTVTSAILFLFRFLLRDISKIYPEKILFCRYLKPSLRILLSNDNTFSEDQKRNIRDKIFCKKQIDLQSIRNKTYKNNTYIQRVDEAFAWLLEVTRFDDILFEYNCIYGFYRNLTAGFLCNTILLFVIAIINKYLEVLPFTSSYLGLGIICFLFTLLFTFLTYKNGMIFAKKVYNVFLSLNEDSENY